MSNRTIFVLILAAVFVTTLSVGLTLLMQDKTQDAMAFLTGGSMFALAVICILGPVLLQDD